MPQRSYDRTWEEIDSMLQEAIRVQQGWIDMFHESGGSRNRDTMKQAARNKKALDGVIKTLQWVLGEEGIEDPLNW